MLWVVAMVFRVVARGLHMVLVCKGECCRGYLVVVKVLRGGGGSRGFWVVGMWFA